MYFHLFPRKLRVVCYLRDKENHSLSMIYQIEIWLCYLLQDLEYPDLQIFKKRFLVNIEDSALNFHMKSSKSLSKGQNNTMKDSK